jgi:hypothetical protein
MVNSSCFEKGQKADAAPYGTVPLLAIYLENGVTRGVTFLQSGLPSLEETEADRGRKDPF